MVTALPCAHVYGNVVMNGAFLTGMTLVLFSRFDPAEALQAIQARRATMFEVYRRCISTSSTTPIRTGST